MSNSTSSSISQSARAAQLGQRAPRNRFRPFRLAVFLVLIALLSLFQQDCFHFAVRQAVSFEAWRNGVDAQIGSVGGSLFEPVVLRDSVWSYEGQTGPVTRLQIKTATAVFSWLNLLPRRSGPWFKS